ncbi:MAG TPA: XrtA/PEP-CTERM system histidine kinase PrsK [Opitutaceae bacterium]|jgi:putative PEP-CTERM system histidine kinase
MPLPLIHEVPLVSAVCAVLIGLAVLLRRQRTQADWAFWFGMLVLGAESLCLYETIRADPDPLLMRTWQVWHVAVTALIPGPWLFFSVTYARGDAQACVRRWRNALFAAVVIPVALVAATFHSLIGSRPAGNASEWLFPLGWSGTILNFLLLAAAVLVLVNLEKTLRASIGTIRWRIKFMLVSVGLIFVVRIFAVSQTLLFRGADVSLENLNAGVIIVAAIFALRSFLRTREISLDVYPSRSVLQNSITIMIAGAYLVAASIFANVFSRIHRGNVFATQALLFLAAIAALIVLLQSDRLRVRLARFVSRHFQRPIYDYRTVWRRFTEGTANQADQTELCRSIVKLVANVFECLSVAIWVVDDRRENLVLAASTFLSPARARELALSREEAALVSEYFLAHREPVSLELDKDPVTEVLRRIHPSEFPKSKNRLCLPMIARGELVGLLILGDRVGRAPFAVQDVDMIKCIGDDATASLQNAQLSQRLLQAKEMEAFQTMAAFFVHDLKNAASTLGLMLKNLPIHFEDPQFRQDALRGVGKSVDHINHVIGRLSSLRNELKLRPAEVDLNELVTESVSELGSTDQLTLAKEFGPVPRLRLDREQIAKVVTNLVLNAKEASPAKSEVHLRTHAEGPWAILTVRDEGCGMSRDFLERSLFRPFQTTKKNGLGIGMFQSKMIVEVHGGRITVSSSPGAGTTFQVFLPLRNHG